MMIPPIVPNFVALAHGFDSLWLTLPWRDQAGVPRRECWMNDDRRPYTYGQGAGERTYEAVDWHTTALQIRDRLFFVYGEYFNACFINGYKDQRDSLGWHSDDSPEIDPKTSIAVVSFGVEREIWFRPIPTEAAPRPAISKHRLPSGSLLMMPPGFQQTHQHRIPKHSATCGQRISLTYRRLVPQS
jgi:alkylated DNA repair dioxygenase AlkB